MAADQWERRQGMRMRDGWQWSNWQLCTEAEAQRVTGLHSWQVRRVSTCTACGGTGRMPGEFAGLLEAVDTLLETAPCDCSHKRRYERGEHLSGCYLFDLNHARNGCKVCGTGGVVGTEATSHKEPREAAFAAPSSAYPSTALCATCGRTWGCHWGRCCDEEPGTDDRRFVHAPDGVRVLGQQEESPEDADGSRKDKT